jgi:RimJ/RimL family protein N-acetyltransferase
MKLSAGVRDSQAGRMTNMLNKVFRTERLILRHWKVDDPAEARSLFTYASDSQIGPRCGWMPHTSVAGSANDIKTVLNGPENYAIVLKETDEPIGCIELKALSGDTIANVAEAIREERLLGGSTAQYLRPLLAAQSKELGYWIGRSYWGKGLMTEALREMLRRAFEDLRAPAVWGGHYVENPASGRVMEHCGLRTVCTEPHHYFPLIDEYHDGLTKVIAKDEWERI